MIKNSFFVLVFCGVFFGNQGWVAQFDGHVWYEKDFYRFFPKNDWELLGDGDKKVKILNSFLKQNVAAQKALA